MEVPTRPALVARVWRLPELQESYRSHQKVIQTSRHHDNLLAVYVGFGKTRELIARKYDWPSLLKDVESLYQRMQHLFDFQRVPIVGRTSR